MTDTANSIVRRLLYLGIICIALGGLWSGVKGGGVLFGAIVGAVLFGAVAGIGVFIAWAASA